MGRNSVPLSHISDLYVIDNLCLSRAGAFLGSSTPRMVQFKELHSKVHFAAPSVYKEKSMIWNRIVQRGCLGGQNDRSVSEYTE